MGFHPAIREDYTSRTGVFKTGRLFRRLAAKAVSIFAAHVARLKPRPFESNESFRRLKI
jgi:hypothetical protein